LALFNKILQKSRTPRGVQVAHEAPGSLDFVPRSAPVEPSGSCTLHILDTKREGPRQVACVVGKDVSRQTYERHKDPDGDLFGSFTTRMGRPCCRSFQRIIWIAARQRIERSTPLEQELAFYCAKDGSKFSVLFTRDVQSEKFRIRSIEGPVPNPPRAGGFAWLQELRSKASDTHKLQCSTLDAKEIDFAGWQCACCKHSAWPAFVQCPKCGRLVCGSRIVAIQNGPKTFVCAPDCGNSGVVEKEILTYETAARRANASENAPAGIQWPGMEPANRRGISHREAERPLLPTSPKRRI